jgi:pyridoxamine 5'-phosphate oxidase
LNKVKPTVAQAPPEEILQHVWQQLTRATVDRHHEWRTPVLSTVGLDGTPQARTVVLRNASMVEPTLTMFTDRRSPKVNELLRQPEAMLVFWSKRLNWQCRVSVSVTVLTEGAEVNAAWQRIAGSAAAKDYLAPLAPGSPKGSQDGSQAAQHFLALLIGRPTSLDWLQLGMPMHRRITFSRDTWHELEP